MRPTTHAINHSDGVESINLLRRIKWNPQHAINFQNWKRDRGPAYTSPAANPIALWENLISDLKKTLGPPAKDHPGRLEEHNIRPTHGRPPVSEEARKSKKRMLKARQELCYKQIPKSELINRARPTNS